MWELKMLTEDTTECRESNADEESTESPRIQRWIIVDADNSGKNVELIVMAEFLSGGLDIRVNLGVDLFKGLWVE
jgi:hypothetical protein